MIHRTYLLTYLRVDRCDRRHRSSYDGVDLPFDAVDADGAPHLPPTYTFNEGLGGDAGALALLGKSANADEAPLAVLARAQELHTQALESGALKSR